MGLECPSLSLNTKGFKSCMITGIKSSLAHLFFKFMGFLHTRSSYGKFTAPNPNPSRFRILKERIVNNKSILEVQYEGCTTFGGRKLLLLGLRWDQIANHSVLDPHLINEGHIVVARFKPNKEGWKFAIACAGLYNIIYATEL